MSLDIFDNELNDYLSDNNKECLMCLKNISDYKLFCSEKCLKNYNND